MKVNVFMTKAKLVTNLHILRYDTLPRPVAVESDKGEQSGIRRLASIDDLIFLHFIPSSSCLFFIYPIWLEPLTRRYKTPVDLSAGQDRYASVQVTSILLVTTTWTTTGTCFLNSSVNGSSFKKTQG